MMISRKSIVFSLAAAPLIFGLTAVPMKGFAQQYNGQNNGQNTVQPAYNQQNTPYQNQGVAASAPLTDLLLRVDALEERMANLTAQTENNNYQMQQMQQKISNLEAQLADMEKKMTAKPAPAPAQSQAQQAAPAEQANTAPAASGEGEIIARPDTGDAGEENYIYGYRLWNAKQYKAAQIQLQLTVEKYPKHARISHARNLLGRAWLDDGGYSSAATIFYDNYKKDPNGDRAPDSLYYLGESLIKLKKNKEACQAFLELSDVYPEVSSGRLSDKLASGKKTAKCG